MNNIDVMGTLFAFSLAFSLSVSVCYVIYKSLLSESAWFSVNRLILLSIILVSVAVYPLAGTLSLTQTPVSFTHVDISATVLVQGGIGNLSGTAESCLRVVLWMYMVVVGIMFLRLIVIAVRLSAMIVRGEKRRVGRYVLVLHDSSSIVPFSWGRWIVLGRKDYDLTSDMTIIHESAHLDRLHWLDLLIAEVMLIIAWYNPFLWLLRTEMQNVHEYEADDAVLRSNVDRRKYQLFLIEKTVGSRFHALTNSLNHSSLNKRITMMLSQKKSRPVLGYASMACAIAGVVMLASQPLVASSLDKVSNSTVIVTRDKGSENNADVEHAEVTITNGKEASANKVNAKIPQFPGGEPALMKFLSENVRYPESVKDKSGMVMVQFIVNENGEVTDPVIAKGFNPEMDAEALRVAKLIPDFIPGEENGKPVAVKFMLPIMFSANQTGK